MLRRARAPERVLDEKPVKGDMNRTGSDVCSFSLHLMQYWFTTVEHLMIFTRCTFFLYYYVLFDTKTIPLSVLISQLSSCNIKTSLKAVIKHATSQYPIFGSL